MTLSCCTWTAAWASGRKKPDRFLAAYTVLFQASGLGKSLLFLRSLEVRYGVYICLRHRKSSGFPLRSAELADWLTGGKDETAARFKAVSRAAVRLCLAWRTERKSKQEDESCKAWLEYMQGTDKDKSFTAFSIELKKAAVRP